ncbi:hemerythrin domain-containing protein [Brachybacterium atlanticum]|uniref:hemerythrin domain-containing protein n=1 Tax=Brachybacterium atlanticum TaxID=2911888 RepID=UPI0021E090B9|nr:hemerythrin domain-containing protein [Brachybacterium atlanticum]
MRRVHVRLREALRVTRESADRGGSAEDPARELLLFCHGFCSALDAHHTGDGRTLFPAIEAARRDLAPVLRALQQDHSMIGHLLGGLEAAVSSRSSPEVLARHLEGIAAIMESHFCYEERQLLTVLEGLALDADPGEALGTL